MQFKSVESALERANSMVYNWKEVNLYVQNKNVMYRHTGRCVDVAIQILYKVQCLDCNYTAIIIIIIIIIMYVC